jgi:hypothetical protein
MLTLQALHMLLLMELVLVPLLMTTGVLIVLEEMLLVLVWHLLMELVFVPLLVMMGVLIMLVDLLRRLMLTLWVAQH